MVNLVSVARRLRLGYEREEYDRLESIRFAGPLEFAFNPDACKPKSSIATGRERLALLRKNLDSFKMKREPPQRLFHHHMIKAAIPFIFKRDLASNLDALLDEFETDRFQQEVLIRTPRRWGKTFAVAWFVAACAASLDNFDDEFRQSIFSPSKRQSGALLELVKRFFNELPGMSSYVTDSNVETLKIRGIRGPNDIRSIHSLPASPKVRYARFSGMLTAAAFGERMANLYVPLMVYRSRPAPHPMIVLIVGGSVAERHEQGNRLALARQDMGVINQDYMRAHEFSDSKTYLSDTDARHRILATRLHTGLLCLASAEVPQVPTTLKEYIDLVYIYKGDGYTGHCVDFVEQFCFTSSLLDYLPESDSD
jgi:hypothetical protein